MPTVARRVLPTVVAVLLLFALTLPPAGAVPSPTAAAGTLQFYGGEVRAIAQLGTPSTSAAASPPSATARPPSTGPTWSPSTRPPASW
jgi:hypothetical protein